MSVQSTIVTVKGQVTIPAEMRRELDIRAGDRVVVSRTGDGVLMQKAETVVEQAYGSLACYARPERIESEREAFGEAVALDNVQDGR